MVRNITAFEDKWYKETTLRKVKVMVGVDVVLEKKVNDCHIDVHLERIKTPTQFEYGLGGDSVLIVATSPKNNDGTEKDVEIKINEAISKSEGVWSRITEDQIIGLVGAFDDYNDAVIKVYERKSEIGK